MNLYTNSSAGMSKRWEIFSLKTTRSSSSSIPLYNHYNKIFYFCDTFNHQIHNKYGLIGAEEDTEWVLTGTNIHQCDVESV